MSQMFCRDLEGTIASLPLVVLNTSLDPFFTSFALVTVSSKEENDRMDVISASVCFCRSVSRENTEIDSPPLETST